MAHVNGSSGTVTCEPLGTTFTNNINIQWYVLDGSYGEHYFRDIEYGVSLGGDIYSSITGAKLPSDSARAAAIRIIINDHKASADLNDLSD